MVQRRERARSHKRFFLHDGNANGRYDAGEGLPGVTVHVAGAGETRTFDAGGWSLPVHVGTYTVRITGHGVPGEMSQTVTVGGTNVRVNFTPRPDDPQADGFVRQLYREALGRDAGPAEVALWRGEVQVHGTAAVAEAVSRSHEARTRLVRAWYGTHLGACRWAGKNKAGFRACWRGPRKSTSAPASWARTSSINASAVARKRSCRPCSGGSWAGPRRPRRSPCTATTSSRRRAGRAPPSSCSCRRSTARRRYGRSTRTSWRRTQEPAPEEVRGWAGSGLDFLHIRLGFLASAEFRDRTRPQGISV